MRLRAVLAATLLVVAAGCGVRPNDARVVGVGPDTHPAALERARQQEEAEAAAAPALDPAPVLDEGPSDELGRITVVLRDETGTRLVERAAVMRSDQPIIDAIVALQEPLSASERAAGLWSEVPADTQVRGLRVARSTVAVDLTGGFALGGTEAAIWRRTQQVACTVLHVVGAPPNVVVEVSLEGEPIGRFGAFAHDDADPCPTAEGDVEDVP